MTTYALLRASVRRDVLSEAVERLRAATRLLPNGQPGDDDAGRWLLVDLHAGSVWRGGEQPPPGRWQRVDA